MVKSIRNTEKCLGSTRKIITNSELKNAVSVKKSIVAKRKIMAGEKFTNENITTKRPDKGISSQKWDQIIGKTSKFSFLKDEFIKI